MRCFFRKWLYLIVAKDGSKPSVSCLNFEPRVSKFPVLEVEATSNTTATMKSHYLFNGRE